MIEGAYDEAAVKTIGMVAAAFTTLAYVPQLAKVLRTRDTAAISIGMFSLISVGLALWLVYGLLIGDAPLIAANALTLVFSLTILAAKIRYG